jgi:O-6-methylguanine DNA methyltransferase
MMRSPGFSFSVLKTSFGRVVVVWRSSSSRVVRVFLPLQYRLFRASAFHRSGVERKPSGMIANNCRQIESLLGGRAIRFDMDSIDWSMASRFQQSVLLMENRIPRGMVSTYGRIALKLGKPGAARAVGNALARNPFPLVIPCHRAIRNDGSLGGYAGGIAMKKRLLELEGVQFDRHGRVITRIFR